MLPLALLLTWVLSSKAETLTPINSFSLTSPYITEALQNRWWEFGGDTIVEVSNFVRLTQDLPHQNGWLWSKMIEVEFSAHGPAYTHGDGLAFWLTSKKEHEGPVFGNENKFEGLGIFFDTFRNGLNARFPYINAMIGDGKTEYVHDMDGKPGEIGSCSINFRGKPWPVKAKIKFVRDQYLKLSMSVNNDDNYETCFNLLNVTLPELTYIGLTAMTGKATDFHDIHRISTFLITDAVKDNSATPQSHQQSDHRSSYSSSSDNGGISWFTLFIIVLVFVVIGYVAITVVRSQNQRNMKRF